MSDNFSEPLKPLVQSGLILILALILVLMGCQKTGANINPQNNNDPTNNLPACPRAMTGPVKY